MDHPPRRRPSLLARPSRTACAPIGLVALAAASASGCADAGRVDVDPWALDDANVRAYQTADAEAPSPGVAGGLAVVEVSAAGSGCPAGGWFTEIADDEKRFRVRLIGYEVALGDGPERNASRACTLTIRLRSEAPVSFAVQSIATIGFAYLDPGVRAHLSTRTYFPEGRQWAQATRRELVGPYDDAFVEQTATNVPVWSRCGLERDVVIDTRLALSRGSTASAGFIAVDEAHGALPGAADAARFGITLAVRPCGNRADSDRRAHLARSPAANNPSRDVRATYVPAMEVASSDTH